MPVEEERDHETNSVSSYQTFACYNTQRCHGLVYYKTCNDDEVDQR
jgi:hypothetical protein